MLKRFRAAATIATAGSSSNVRCYQVSISLQQSRTSRCG